MNEQTIRLIETLALKLDTTAEHLWAILIAQAPISSTIGILTNAAIIVALYFMWKKLLTIKYDNWDNDLGKGVMFGGISVATIIGIAIAGGNLQVEIAGFVNPEYWALRQIIK